MVSQLAARRSQPHLANTKRTRTNTFDLLCNHYLHDRVSVETGNWHVFPIDNPPAWARMAIAGARAELSSPADAREP
jgi:hypothetical protein